LKLKYVCPNDWDWGSCRPSIKYKQEVNYGEKMVGNDRVARPEKKTGRSYQIPVKPF
jgi:hypothetical protein